MRKPMTAALAAAQLFKQRFPGRKINALFVGRHPRPCPNCGKELGRSWKRACSRECHAELK